jgi:hypothetical protein
LSLPCSQPEAGNALLEALPREQIGTEGGVS